MSRTRLIRPAFFGDEDVAAIPRDSRLAYIGLWTECDDAGYFEARPRQLARALFGYDPDGLAVVEAALADLIKLGKVELLECGVHGLVPSLPVHGQQGGNKAFTHQVAHGRCGVSVQVRTPDEPVRTTPPAAVRPERVRTRPDKSSSESVSDSESVQRREKKNVKEEVVVEATVGTERATPSPAPFLSDPSSAGRPDASEAIGPARVAVPPRIAQLTPAWRHPCTDYVRHQNEHRLIDGVAVCAPCEAKLEQAAANGTPPADPAVSIWGPVQ